MSGGSERGCRGEAPLRRLVKNMEGGRRDERGSRRDEVTVHMWVGKSVRCIGRKIRSITAFNNLYL